MDLIVSVSEFTYFLKASFGLLKLQMKLLSN